MSLFLDFRYHVTDNEDGTVTVAVDFHRPPDEPMRQEAVMPLAVAEQLLDPLRAMATAEAIEAVIADVDQSQVFVVPESLDG